MNMEIRLTKDITPVGSDYRTVSDIIALLTEDYQAQPSLDAIARKIGQDPTELHHAADMALGEAKRRRQAPRFALSGS